MNVIRLNGNEVLGMSNYSQVWDLESIFKGGSESSFLLKEIQELKRVLPLLKERIEAISTPISLPEWEEVLDQLQRVKGKLIEIESFINCLISQDVKDEKAKLLLGSVTQLGAGYEAAKNVLERKAAELSDQDWKDLHQSDNVKEISFVLDEMRRKTVDKLSLDQEELIEDLSIDGYHAWWEMYNTIVGQMQVPFEEQGKTKFLSMGQLSNKLQSPDRMIRQQAFEKWEGAWQSQAGLCSSILNHLSGYRLQVYKHRNWKSVLKEPLEQNRMQEQTLRTMWKVIEDEKHRLIPYFERKSKLLGLSKLTWYDVYAPLSDSVETMSYDEAAAFIIDQFNRFDPNMAAFAQMAFEKRWIEAEDRPGKRPGGFMTSFPISRESRIFMTFSGTPQCISTLAHELGHAYHTYVMRDLPIFTQQYAMNVAESASTFAEMIVRDAAIKKAVSTEEKMNLLADKIESTVAFLMDIHTRFLFETRFYEARKEGPISTNQLCQLMVEAQKEGFSNMLSQVHPFFWASKLHFYATDVPFYNFPYTFGYVFSTGIYMKALQEASTFAQKYVNLLRDTSRMTVEDLAMSHLDIDLGKEHFWKSTIDLLMEDVEEFLSLT